MKRFDPRKFKGKQIRVKSNYKGIEKMYTWNEKLKRYVIPRSGLHFYTLRYDPTSGGRTKRVFRSFPNLVDAKKWQKFQYHDGEKPTDKKHYKTLKDFERSETTLKENEAGSLVAEIKEAKGYTLVKLYEDFKEHRFSFLKTGSQRHYIYMMKNFSFLFTYKIEDITPYVIDDLIRDLKSLKKMKNYRSSRCDFEKELDALRSIFNWHIQHNRISNWSNPVRKEHYEMSKIKNKTQKIRNYMTEEEKNLWYETLKGHRPQFFAPAFIQTEQVMRASETFAMTWDNLDLRNKSYFVSGHVIWDRVKDPKPYILQGTKTQGTAFLMPLRTPVVKVLEKLYDERNKKSNYIFHDGKGNIWQYKNIQNAYEHCFKKAKLPFSGTHVCRHTGATLFLEKTGDPLALQEIGNWKTQTQAMHYGKILKQRLRRVIDKMDD